MKPVPVSDGPGTLASFGALTPEMIQEETPEDRARQTLELGTITDEGDVRRGTFVPREIHPADSVIRREPAHDETPGSGAAARAVARAENRRLLPAIGLFLLFGLLVAGGWRVARTILDGRSEAAPKAAVERPTDRPQPAPEPVTEHVSVTVPVPVPVPEPEPATATATAAETRRALEPLPNRVSDEPEGPNMEGFFLEDSPVPAVAPEPDVVTEPDVVAAPDVLAEPDVVPEPDVVSEADVVVEPDTTPAPTTVRKPPKGTDPGFSMDDLQ